MNVIRVLREKNMTIGERILLSISRAPGTEDYDAGDWTVDNALSLLEREYPNFGALVAGKKVVDFGCGAGYQSIALALRYGCSVTGIDINQRLLLKAIKQAAPYDIPESRLSFTDKISDSMTDKFDIVISQNSFEHFSDPPMILDEMRKLIHASGKLLITFGPPWFAPYGSHMQFFCKVPWVNVLFSEETVMRVRSRFRDDGATTYGPGLNKMTIRKLERLLAFSRLNVEFKTYRCVKGVNVLSKIPFLREFFINDVTLILSKAQLV